MPARPAVTAVTEPDRWNPQEDGNGIRYPVC